MIEKSQNMHALRSRLCFELDSTLKAVVEPMQSAVSECSSRHNSALLAGDITSSMMSLLAHCIGSLHIGMELTTLSKMFVNCIKRSVSFVCLIEGNQPLMHLPVLYILTFFDASTSVTLFTSRPNTNTTLWHVLPCRHLAFALICLDRTKSKLMSKATMN